MKDRPHSPRKNDSSGMQRVSGQFESSSELVKDVAQMLPEEKPGAPPREATCAALGSEPRVPDHQEMKWTQLLWRSH